VRVIRAQHKVITQVVDYYRKGSGSGDGAHHEPLLPPYPPDPCGIWLE
jgi:hypothetical protein